MKTLSLLFISFLLFTAASCTTKNPEVTGKKDKPVENQAKDTISFEKKSLMKTYNGCNPDTGECTYIKFDYELMKTGSLMNTFNKAILDSISIFMNVSETPVVQPVEKIAESFIESYKTFIKENSDYQISWFSEVIGKVIYQNSKIISYQVSRIDFEGGAHPNSYLDYYIFSIAENRILKYNDIIKPGSEDKISELITKRLKEMHKLKENESLEKAGFWEKNIKLNDTFVVTKEGLEFYYNNYEIAPYALGPTAVQLKWEELGDLILQSGLK
jgi:hypothetical protein